MKLFTAAEKNESLAEVFKAECASMRSQLSSAQPTPHSTPKKQSTNEFIQMDEEMKESNVSTVCKLCNERVVGSVPSWDAKNMVVAGALAEHFKTCRQLNLHKDKMAKCAKEWKHKLNK